MLVITMSLKKIIAEVDGEADPNNENLHLAINQTMRYGIHDRINNTWYPPHQVRKIEYVN